MSSVPLDRSPAPRKMSVDLPSVRSGQNMERGVVVGEEPTIKADRWNCLSNGIGWPAGVVIALFLIGAALIFIPLRTSPLANVAYVILALYLANWLYILAFVALALLIIWLVIKAKTVCRQAAP